MLLSFLFETMMIYKFLVNQLGMEYFNQVAQYEVGVHDTRLVVVVSAVGCGPEVVGEYQVVYKAHRVDKNLHQCLYYV